MKKVLLSLLAGSFLFLNAEEFIVKNDALKTNIKVVTEKQNGQEVKKVFRDNREVQKIVTSFHKNGKTKMIEQYKNNQLNGMVVEYYESGVLKTKTYYKDNAINGLKVSYTEKGDLISEESYKNNIKEGKSNNYKKGNLSNN